MELPRDALRADLVSATGSAALIAMTLHWCFLRVVTIENHLALLLWLYVLAICGISFAYIVLAELPVVSTFIRVGVISTSFNVSLMFSIGVYRLFFHRLRHFPGPFWSKLSRFSDLALAAKEVKYHREVKKMHDLYGDFIRTGKSTYYYH